MADGMSVDHGALVVGAAVVTGGMGGRAPPPSWAALKRKRKFAPEILELHTSQEERKAREKMRRLQSEPGSLWAQMVDAEHRQRQDRLQRVMILSSALRRRLALLDYTLMRADSIRLDRWQRKFQPLSDAENEAADKAADNLCQRFGLRPCLGGGELPGFASFISHMQTLRYACRVCTPAVANAQRELAFQEAKAKEGGESFFAWHGSPLKNWPGIIATGLKVTEREKERERERMRERERARARQHRIQTHTCLYVCMYAPVCV